MPLQGRNPIGEPQTCFSYFWELICAYVTFWENVIVNVWCLYLQLPSIKEIVSFSLLHLFKILYGLVFLLSFYIAIIHLSFVSFMQAFFTFNCFLRSLYHNTLLLLWIEFSTKFEIF